MNKVVFLIAEILLHVCGEASLKSIYFQHMRYFNAGHIRMIKMDLNENLELSPPNFLYFIGRPVNF